MGKTLIHGKRKWTLSGNERRAIVELAEGRTAKIIPAPGKWKVYFLGFSRSGCTSGALAYQQEINRQPVQGKNWGSTGMRLLIMDELDDDLPRWTKRIYPLSEDSCTCPVGEQLIRSLQ